MSSTAITTTAPARSNRTKKALVAGTLGVAFYDSLVRHAFICEDGDDVALSAAGERWFAGIGIALLGRNHPVGIAVAALLWAFLDQQSNALQIRAGVASELVNIIQGVILFAVVIAYELVRRTEARLEQQRVARELAAGGALATPAAPEGAKA